MAFHVYVITHVLSDRKYVGTTNNPKKCWEKHQAARGTSPLDLAFDEFGREPFSFEVVATFQDLGTAQQTKKRLITQLGADQRRQGFNDEAEGESRDEELARLIKEQRIDASQDKTGLSRTCAGEFYAALGPEDRPRRPKATRDRDEDDPE